MGEVAAASCPEPGRDDQAGSVQDLLVEYLGANALEGRIPASGITPQTRYLDAGLLNSLGLIMLIEFLEERFTLRFGAEDLQSYEFQTVGGLAGLIERLRNTDPGD